MRETKIKETDARGDDRAWQREFEHCAMMQRQRLMSGRRSSRTTLTEAEAIERWAMSDLKRTTK